MRKLWIAILLTPCFTFAAYPIYENDFEEEEVGIQHEQETTAKEEPLSNVVQYGMRQEPVVQEEPLVLEDSAQEEELTAIPPKKEESKVKSPTQVRKRQAATAKRAPMKKNPALQNSTSPRTQVQKSRENSNRPKVTQRNEKKTQENLIEADAQGDAPTRVEKEPVQKQRKAPMVKKQTSQVQKEEVVKSAPVRERGAKASVNRKNLKKQAPKKVSSHRPGKRPLSE